MRKRKKECWTNPFDWIVKQRLVKLILSCYGLGVLAPTLQLWILKEHSSQLSTLHTNRTHPVFGSGLGKDLFLRKALGGWGSWLDLQWYIWIFGWLNRADMCLFPQRFLSQLSPSPPPPPNLFHFSRGQTEPSSNFIQPAPQLKGPLSIFLCLGTKPASRIQRHGPFNGAAGQKCNHIPLRM